MDHQVEIIRLQGSKPGQTLLLVGGIHGDELASCLAVERYTRLQLKRGQMIIIPRLNQRAILAGQRGLNGVDMNRLFDLPEEKLPQPEGEVINLIKKLVKEASCVVNTHQGSGFYSPTWINRQRNPARWGQCNVIDAPFFDLPNGEQLRLEEFANRVVRKANLKIKQSQYHFQVNNTNTASEHSRHKEQRKSLTYYALTQTHRMALGVEVTKDCSLTEAVSFMTIAINAVMEELGIVPTAAPLTGAEAVRKELTEQNRLNGLTVLVNGKKKTIPVGGSIFLQPGETLTLVKLETPFPLGWSVQTRENKERVFPDENFAPARDTTLQVRKDSQRYLFPVRVRKSTVTGLEVALSQKVRTYYPQETIILPARQSFKIVRVLGETDGPVTVDIKGFVGNQRHNDGRDSGYEVTAEKLRPRFALDAEKTLYRIEVRKDNLLLDELFLKVVR